jgi:hypothetical protein
VWPVAAVGSAGCRGLRLWRPGGGGCRWWRALSGACSPGSRPLAHPLVGDCTETVIRYRFLSTRRYPPGRVHGNRCLMTLRVHSPRYPCASARKPWFERGAAVSRGGGPPSPRRHHPSAYVRTGSCGVTRWRGICCMGRAARTAQFHRAVPPGALWRRAAEEGGWRGGPAARQAPAAGGVPPGGVTDRPDRHPPLAAFRRVG